MQPRRIGLLRIAIALSAMAVVFVANGLVDPVSAVAARVTAATTKPATTKPATTKGVPTAYVANEGSDTVSVIDLDTDIVNATIPFGVRAHECGPHPERQDSLRNQ